MYCAIITITSKSVFSKLLTMYMYSQIKGINLIAFHNRPSLSLCLLCTEPDNHTVYVKSNGGVWNSLIKVAQLNKQQLTLALLHLYMYLYIYSNIYILYYM